MRGNSVTTQSNGSNILAAALFMGQFFYLWVTLDPYVPEESVSVDPGSNLLNQLVAITLFGGMIFYVIISPLRKLVLQPRPLIMLLLACLLLTGLFSPQPVVSLKQFVLSGILLFNASVFLLLPRSEEQFCKLMIAGLFIMLGFAYFGVLFKPLQAIHQYSVALGNELVGNWRGHFTHKNVASAAMMMCSCFALYVKDKGFYLSGWLLLLLALFFLVHTGGKTSTAMFPLILLIAFIFEKIALSRWPIVLGGVLAINFLTVGAALLPAVYGFIESLGIDPTFTNRSDIWRFAVRAIADRPFLGHGLHGFWLSETLLNNDTVENWSPRAFNGHNAWVDTLINLGVIGFILIFIWVIILPLWYIRRISQNNSYSPLVRLYVRIWLYGLFSSALESVFFETGSLLWFSIMMAIFGLRLQTVAIPVSENTDVTMHNSIHEVSNLKYSNNTLERGSEV